MNSSRNLKNPGIRKMDEEYSETWDDEVRRMDKEYTQEDEDTSNQLLLN